MLRIYKFSNPKSRLNFQHKFISTSYVIVRPPRHPFHIVTLRPWPIAVGGFTLGLAGGLAS